MPLVMFCIVVDLYMIENECPSEKFLKTFGAVSGRLLASSR